MGVGVEALGMSIGKMSRLGKLLGVICWVWGSALPVWAQDPFRSGDNARPIRPEVAAAFEEFFCAGRYSQSREKLAMAKKASPEEPMVYALLAALAYQEGDLEAFAQLATQTRQVAAELKKTDPLRGNLYEGVGYGLEAANIVVRDGGSRSPLK
jgi:hypothetical protein